MLHQTSLIATIVAGLSLAFVFALVANRIRLSPLVGYLLAGVAIGPFTPGYGGDQALAPQLAEIGVILLMFGVGLHFSLKDLLAVKAVAIPGAVAQMAIATLLGMALAWAMGWPVGAGLVFGLALSVASTVVLLRALQERRIVQTEKGRIAVGWLIVEDLAMVLALVLLPAIAELLGGKAAGAPTGHADLFSSVFHPETIWGVLGLTLMKVMAFVCLMLVIGRRVIPWVLHYVAHTGQRELFRLAVLAIALGVAFGSAEWFGVSFALGAFFAGMILAESQLSHRAAEEILPLRDAFAVLFFVSVGMLFDPTILLREPLPVLATVLIIMVGKSLAALGIVRLFGRPMSTALTISASLAQIGEFSFILATLGIALGLLPDTGRDLILAGALLSIVLNPLLFVALDRFGPREAKPEEAAPDLPRTAKSGHVVLVGYGRVGRFIGETLSAKGVPFLVIEESDKVAARLRGQGLEVIQGPAGDKRLLDAANLAGARTLVCAISNPFEASNLIERGRAANPGLRIVVRAHSDAEADHLAKHGADIVLLGERELARGMAAVLDGDAAPAAVGPAPVGRSDPDSPAGALARAG